MSRKLRKPKNILVAIAGDSQTAKTITEAEYAAQPYYEKIKALGLDLSPGTIQHINILHDDWCQLIKGSGPCNCNPDVQKADIERK